MVQSLSRKAMLMCPKGVMSDVNGGHDAPRAVNLGVILVDFGDNEEDWSEEQRDRKGEYKRVGTQVENAQLIELVAAQQRGVD